MLSPYSKAIGAFIGSLVALLVAFGLLPPDLVTPEIIGGIAAVAATVAVYFAPKNKLPPPRPTITRSPALAGLLAVALSLLIMGCATTPQTPRQALFAVDATFGAAVEELLTLRAVGLIAEGSETDAKAKTIVADINLALIAAHAAASVGELNTVTDYLRVINEGLLTLTRLMNQSRRISSNERFNSGPLIDRRGHPFFVGIGRSPSRA